MIAPAARVAPRGTGRRRRLGPSGVCIEPRIAASAAIVRRVAAPAAGASIRVRAHVRVGRRRYAAGQRLAHVRLRRDRRAQSRLHRRRPRAQRGLPAGRRGCGRGRRRGERSIRRRGRLVRAGRPRRRPRARCQAADRRGRGGVEDPRVARHRDRRTRLSPGRAGRPRAHGGAAPRHCVAAVSRHGAARIPASARRPLLDRVERRARRGGSPARPRCGGLRRGAARRERGGAR